MGEQTQTQKPSADEAVINQLALQKTQAEVSLMYAQHRISELEALLAEHSIPVAPAGE